MPFSFQRSALLFCLCVWRNAGRAVQERMVSLYYKRFRCQNVLVVEWIQYLPPKEVVQVQFPPRTQRDFAYKYSRGYNKNMKKTQTKNKPVSSVSVQKTRKKVTKPSLPKTPKIVKRAAKKLKLIGKVTHYYDNIKVAVIKLKDVLREGDGIRIEGGDTSFSQEVVSMQYDHEKILKAKSSQEIGLKVKKKVRDGYRVFKE